MKRQSILPSWDGVHGCISRRHQRRHHQASSRPDGKKGLKDAGYHYVNVDDGYFGKRDDNGIMHTHEQRFPNGMKPIADYVHGLGMKAGLYTDAGNSTCGSMWDNDAAGVGAGIYGHEPQDAQLYFGDWGFDFIKLITAEEMRWDLMKRNATLPSGTV